MMTSIPASGASSASRPARLVSEQLNRGFRGGVGQPDWLIGDGIVHTDTGGGYADVTWTSPINGAVNLSGAVWAVRDIGRSNNWSLYHGATLLTQESIGNGDVYSRSSPDFFSLGSGGAGTLSNLLVAISETI